VLDVAHNAELSCTICIIITSVAFIFAVVWSRIAQIEVYTWAKCMKNWLKKYFDNKFLMFLKLHNAYLDKNSYSREYSNIAAILLFSTNTASHTARNDPAILQQHSRYIAVVKMFCMEMVF